MTEKNHLNPITLSIAQAQQSLGVSKKLLYRYLDSGELKSIMLGRRRLIRADDLAQFVNARPAVGK